MADATAEELEQAPAKRSKLPLLIGLVLSIVGGGGSFFALYSGWIFAPEPIEEQTASDSSMRAAPLESVAFVPLGGLAIVLEGDSRGTGRSAILKFEAQLEVPRQHVAAVEMAMPRIIDMLNTYLRLVDVRDLSNPGMLPELRAQMLRRLQRVVEADHVQDLLIQHFIVN